MASAVYEKSENFTNTAQRITSELDKFVAGTSRNDLAVTPSALFLLRNLPCSRDAVLHHLGSVFDTSVAFYMQHQGSNQSSAIAGSPESIADEYLDQIETLLLHYIKANPTPWCPLLSAWALDLLGMISSKHTAHTSLNSTLNENLQLWMNCPATHVLLNITSHCFSALIGGDPISSVASLLDASVRYSPHFDWVVAHIGSCFPLTIIERVLRVGLKDYYAHPERFTNNKITSVVAIVGHLASHHRQDIWNAIHTLFTNSLVETDQTTELHSTYVVPYILHLTTMSPTILEIITNHIHQLATIENLNKIALTFVTKKDILNQSHVLIDLVVRLMIKVNKASFNCLQLLLNLVFNKDTTVTSLVLKNSKIVLDRLMLELHRAVYSRNSNPQEIILLLSLQDHTTQLCDLMAKSRPDKAMWMCRLLACVAGHGPAGLAAEILSYIVSNAPNVQQLALFHQYEITVRVKHNKVLHQSIALSLNSLSDKTSEDRKRILDNLITLLVWEKQPKGRTPMAITSISSVIKRHFLSCITSQLYNTDTNVALPAVRLLSHLNVSIPQLTVAQILQLSCGVANLFFTALQSMDLVHKNSCSVLCVAILRRLSTESIVGHKVLLRVLLQKALDKNYSQVFGSMIDNTELNKPCGQSSLLSQTSANMRGVGGATGGLKEETTTNMDTNSAPAAPPTLVSSSLTVAFHAGVIGKGLMEKHIPSPFSKEDQLHNRQLLLEVLWEVSYQRATLPHSATDNYFASVGQSPGSSGGGGSSGSDSRTDKSGSLAAAAVITPPTGQCLALLLIELVAPDVIYNGIPWPCEDFIKVTIERDLAIMKKFNENPILWDIVEFTAQASGSMCFCSSLLRSVCATLMSFWETCRHDVASACPVQLHASIRLVTTMRRGQLLPPPLSFVSELFDLLSPYEVHLLLATVWKYMKENPPVPDERETANRMKGCEPRYTQVIHSILHKNINKFGHVYSRFIS